MGKTLELVAMVSDFLRLHSWGLSKLLYSSKTSLEHQHKYGLPWLQALVLQVCNDDKQFVACRVSFLRDMLKYTILVI